jgi:hypothetical protein
MLFRDQYDTLDPAAPASAAGVVECAMPAPQPVVLTPHLSTPCDAIRAFEVRVEIREPALLVIEYRLQGDLAGFRIPPPRTAQRVDELWKHTCFEAFLVTDDSPGYEELNFSPSGEWAAYRFSAYRTGMTPADGVGVPTTRVAREATALQVSVAIAISAIREARQTATPLRIAFAAVIEDGDGKMSYWAQRHPPGKPDFHHPDGFALEISL